MYKEKSCKITSSYQKKIKTKTITIIFKKVNANNSKKKRNYRLHMAGITQNNQKLWTSYGRDNTKQPEIIDFIWQG